MRADRGSVVVTGDVTGSTITVGYNAAQLLELVDAEKRKATAPLQAQIDDFGKRLGVTDEAVRTFLRILGEKDFAPDKLADKLAEITQRHKRDAATAGGTRPCRSGHQGADRAGARRGGEGRLRRSRPPAGRRRNRRSRRRAAGRTTRDRGPGSRRTALPRGRHVALGRIDYLAAAEHFRQAAARVPAGRPDVRADYLQRRADALYRQGDEFGDNGAL